jgi:hypothetical protein
MEENKPIIIGLVMRSTPQNYRKIEDFILLGSLAEILFVKRTFPHRLLRIVEVPKENNGEKHDGKFSYHNPSISK